MICPGSKAEADKHLFSQAFPQALEKHVAWLFSGVDKMTGFPPFPDWPLWRALVKLEQLRCVGFQSSVVCAAMVPFPKSVQVVFLSINRLLLNS